MQSSARRNISYPSPDRSDRPDVPAHILNLVNALEQDVIFNQGPDGDRQGSAHQTGGGRFWWATDTLVLWYDDGANWNSLASATQANPVGTVLPFAGSVAPNGYLLCDGSPVSRTTYANLLAAIGTAYGGGDGTTTFNLPDMRGRVPVGKNTGTFNALGKTGGEETHVTTVNEIPAHGHTVNNATVTGSTDQNTTALSTGTDSPDHYHQYNQPNPITVNQLIQPGSDSLVVFNTNTPVSSVNTSGRTVNHYHTIPAHVHTFTANPHNHTVQNTGGGLAHNNLQPYLTLNYIIKT